MQQQPLFDLPPAALPPLPPGFVYRPDFLTQREEAHLIAAVQALPLREAHYKQYTARRRIVSYGGRYDFSANELMPAGPIPDFLHPLRDRICGWTGIAATELNHALIAEYQPGTPLGWHRDVPEFEMIVGVSLAGPCRMRLRPYPPKRGRDPAALGLDLAARSAYWIRDAARWGWQHAISPTKTLRYSITFRTLRRPCGNGIAP